MTNSGTGALNWNVTDPVDWLLKSTGSGSTPGTVEITLDNYLLPTGTYQSTVTFSPSGGSPVVMPVTMTVTPEGTAVSGGGGSSSGGGSGGSSGGSGGGSTSPILTVSPASISTNAQVGSSGPLTSYLNISNTGGGGNLSWSVTDPVDWVIKSVDSGTTPGSVSVSLYPNGLPAGTYTTNVTVTASGVSGSPKVIPVTMTVGSGSTASASLSWNANSESDLAGYKVYYGTSSGNYTSSINVGKVTNYTVTGLATGRTYYFALTAYDTTGNESAKSSERSVSR
ncbi:hypothetical protein W02_01730 [Nitrospira sp. KM1]|nr:hypothetical protein W02_01730 [Nitrospira sp. KM1]